MHERIKRFLHGCGVGYLVHRHEDMSRPINTPADFAEALGYDYGRIAKTLLLRAKEQDIYCVVVAPFKTRVNFDAVRKALRVQRVHLASSEELSRIVGYPPKAVSPLDVGNLCIFMYEELFDHPTVLIGSGEVGVEIEISPRVLLDITKATAIDLSVHDSNRV